jgi:hypothetical protein
MAYNPNIPQPSDLLSVSQGDLLNNNTVSNTIFGVDHYAFSDVSGNAGKHNQVTTPLIQGAVHPTTAADEPKFYAMQDSANLGVIQYSRLGSDAFPSPVSYFESPATDITLAPSGGTSNILDFTGISRAFGRVVAANFSNVNPLFGVITDFTFFDNGAGGLITTFPTLSALVQVIGVGRILQLRNLSLINYTNIAWTCMLWRIQV